MSLIEAALEKAKKLVDTGSHRTPKLSPQETEPPVRKRRSEPDAAVIAARKAEARVLPATGVDAQTMERHGVVLKVTDIAAEHAYRILRTRVQQRMAIENWRSVAITGAGSGEGKTLTAINLAISLARDPSTWVVLVDLDLQRPQVASYLGMKFDKGLSDYLAGTAEFEEVLYSPGIERLRVIPSAGSMERSSDVLGSPRVRELCQALAAERPQHIVIFDMPPLLMSDDVLKFYPNVDCVLCVVSEGVTSRPSLQRASEALREMNLLGVVLNRAAERDESGYY